MPRLQAGAHIADVGCCVGFSTLLFAQRLRTGLRIGRGFATASAKDIAERAFDLITMFDCLHDMGENQFVMAVSKEVIGLSWR